MLSVLRHHFYIRYYLLPKIIDVELMGSEIIDFQAVQQAVFHEVALAINKLERFDLDISLAPANEQAKADLSDLVQKRLMMWDFKMKSHPAMLAVSNPDPEHLIHIVLYYGNRDSEYSCIGTALGTVNQAYSAVELDYIEKRKDAGKDFEDAFMPVITYALTAYTRVLNVKYAHSINKLVLVNPVEGVVNYYNKLGFQGPSSSYDNDRTVMYKDFAF